MSVASSPLSVLSHGTLRNLRESGLTDETIELAEIHEPLREAGVQATSYVIPYFDVDGVRTDFSRTRHLVPSKGSKSAGKYSQAPGTPAHVYIPPHYAQTAPGWAEDPSYRLIVTEGEKKALAAAQNGILCIGLGGVDNWVSRTKVLPVEYVKHIEYGEKRKAIIVRIEKDATAKLIEENVAEELTKIDWRGREVLIAFDTPDSYTKEGVMRAQFQFGMWLYRQGAHVGVYYLPSSETDPNRKVGLDDWLLNDPDAAEALLDPPEYRLFPPPPNPRTWLHNAFDARLTRNEQEEIAMGVLAALDSRGERYKDPVGLSYYYEKDTKSLHAFSWGDKSLQETTFGGILNNMGLRTTDASVMSRLSNLYVNEGFVREIEPHRVLAKTDDAIYIQLSDGEMARITSDSIDILDNGTDDILFVAGTVAPVDLDYLTDALGSPPRRRWFNAVKSLRLKPIHPLNLDQTQAYLTTLMYLSPWLWRWRGMQLPLEMAVAEPGSGKTFLYNLRMEVLTGSPELFGMPTDMRDWIAQVGAAPSLWVCDNLGKLDSTTFHKLSDELARLITEPRPSVKLREFYTEASLKTVPIECAFAITAVKNGFTSPDITQRMVLYHLDAIPPSQRNPGWYREQLDEGREPWLAEHMQYLQRFLQLAEGRWNPSLVQQHRLVHFEQGVMLMGEALGFPEAAMQSIRKQLSQTVDLAVAETNPFIEALLVFKAEQNGAGPYIPLQEVVDWAKYDPSERFTALNQFNNSRQLGNAFRANPAQIQRSTGLELVNRNNQSFVRMGSPDDDTTAGRKTAPTTPNRTAESRVGPPARPSRQG